MNRSELVRQLRRRAAISRINHNYNGRSILVTAADFIESYDERKIINEFVAKVDALAQQKMLITGVREGAHYAAMKQLQQEMNDE